MATDESGPDDIIILTPGVEFLSQRKDNSSECQTLPRTLQPLMGHYPWLPGQVQRSVQSADAETSMLGNLTKHEAATLYLLLSPYSPQNQCFYKLLQRKLITDDSKELAPFMPCLYLTLVAFRKLPRLWGNIWYKISGDLTELYPLGHVFAWGGFLKCYYNMESLEAVNTELSARICTLFSIVSTSGRIIRQLSDGDDVPQVMLLPGAYYQVISISNTTDNMRVIHVKEINPPENRNTDALPECKTTQALSETTPSIHPYWASVLADSCRSVTITGIIRMLAIAHDLGDVALQISCLRSLGDMPRLEGSMLERTKLLSMVLNIMKMYTAFRMLQIHGCAVLRLLAQSEEILKCHTSWCETVPLVLGPLVHHRGSERLTLNALETLSFVFHTCEDGLFQNLVDVVLSSMMQHSKSKDIQLAGCELINHLSKTHLWVSVAKERGGYTAILNGIRLHRGDMLASVICWRALLTVGSHVNNNNNCLTLHKPTYGSVDFLDLVKEAVRVFAKHPHVQAEGLQALWTRVQETPDFDVGSDRDYLELVISALRHHGQNAQVVECACGILSELTKTPSQTHLVVSDGGIACVLSAMNHHFNSPSVQEYGCKILRTVATNGFRPYNQDTPVLKPSILVENASPRAIPDYRLKIVEAGGREVVLSAMKTHLQHIGVQRQGCLAIRTLDVAATNVVETNGTEEISIVLDALSKHITNVNVTTAALRAVVILIINPPNKRAFIDNNGLILTLHVVRYFPNCIKIQEEGFEILANLATDENCASRLLFKGFVKDILSTVDLYPSNSNILTSGCSLLASLCSVPVDNINECQDILPMVLVAERGGFERIDAIMAEFRSDSLLQIQGCRALYALAVPPVNTSMLSESAGLTSVVVAMKTHSSNTALLETACEAMGNLVNIRDDIDTQVPTDAIDQVLLALKSYPQKKKIQIVSLSVLGIIMTKDSSSIRYIANHGIISPVLSSMQLFLDEPSFQKVSLKILRILLLWEAKGSVWQQLLALVIRRENRLWEEFCAGKGLDIVRDALRIHMSSRDIVYFGGEILISNNAENFTSQFAKEVVELSEQIEASYSADVKEIHALCASLKILVNRHALTTA